MNTHFDIVVVGAGTVGLCAALGAAQQGYSVCVIDKAPAPKASSDDEFSPRVSAISQASERYLIALGVWEKLARKQAYSHMHVWDTDGFGHIHFDADSLSSNFDFENANLGHIIENNVLNFALFSALEEQAKVSIACGASINQMSANEDAALVSYTTGNGVEQQISAKVLLGADGGNSRVREHFGFKQTYWDYDQQAIVCNVKTEKPHGNTARQAFTPFGPLAFLPLPDPHQSSIVFSQKSDEAMRLLSLETSEFEKALQVAIDNDYGKCRVVGERQSFNLRMQYARTWTAPRVAILGDAAHTIHPLAGQGVNLGIADAEVLLDLFSQYPDDFYSARALRRYERKRKAEAIKLIATMQGFSSLFLGNDPIKKLVRNSGLFTADKLDVLKSFFIAQASA